MKAEVEEAIRARLAAEDRLGATDAAVRGYGPQILGYLRRVTHDEQAAAETFSFFCEAVWKQIGQYRGESSFLTWAYRLAWGAVCRYGDDAYRRRARRLRTTEIGRLAQEVYSSSARVHDEMEDRLARLRAKLTADEQTLLILRVDRDLPWRDIAVIVATDDEPVDEAALRKRFERLKAKVRKLAEADGVLQAR